MAVPSCHRPRHRRRPRRLRPHRRLGHRRPLLRPHRPACCPDRHRHPRHRRPGRHPCRLRRRAHGRRANATTTAATGRRRTTGAQTRSRRGAAARATCWPLARSRVARATGWCRRHRRHRPTHLTRPSGRCRGTSGRGHRRRRRWCCSTPRGGCSLRSRRPRRRAPPSQPTHAPRWSDQSPTCVRMRINRSQRRPPRFATCWA